MHRQERLLRWEQETLPRLLQLRGSLESVEGDLAAFSRRFGMVTQRRDRLRAVLRSHLPEFLALRRRFFLSLRAVQQCFSERASSEKYQHMQPQEQGLHERVIALQAQVTELEQSRP